jgi:hypothetical protein
MKVLRMLANGAMAATPLAIMAFSVVPVSPAAAASSAQHGPSHHGSSDPGSGVNGSSGIMGQTPEPPAATSAPRRPMPTPRTDADPANRPRSGATMTNPAGTASSSSAKPASGTGNPATTPRDTPASSPTR